MFALASNPVFVRRMQAQRVEEFKKAQLARATDILKRQAGEKKDRDEHLAKLYRNAIAPEFFTQFGTSHR